MRTITPIGITNWRNHQQPFGIKQEDRFGHIYCIGKTGTGKSTLLQRMAIADIEGGNGLCIIDPHGDIAENILHYIPKERVNDVIYFNPQDEDCPVGFNPLRAVHPKHHHLVASGLVATFKKVWSESWGPRLEYILRNTIITLLDYPEATLLDIQPLLTDPYFRYKVLPYCTNAQVLSFWKNEFEKYPPQLKSEAIAPILNKVGIFFSSTILKHIVGQTRPQFKMREEMEQKKILICNLSKGAIGEDVSMILGSMLVTAIQMEALYRATQQEAERVPFYLYVDEMHSFVSVSFSDILSEARKYKLSLFLTHQYIEQLDERIRSAVFGNVGTLIAFRVGAADAKELAREFFPPFSAEDLIRQKKFSMLIKLMIDGATSKPFSAMTLPIEPATHSNKTQIIEHSQMYYGMPKQLIIEALEKKRVREETRPTLFGE